MTPQSAELQKDYREDEEALRFALNASVRDGGQSQPTQEKGLKRPSRPEHMINLSGFNPSFAGSDGD